MHSFEAKNNKVSWKVLIKGTPATWPEYELAFPVVVLPPYEAREEL